MSENLALWRSVEKTDTRHVKEITGKAYRGNSPKPYWLIQRATETFGPCGIGWGFVIVEEKLLDGALLAPGFFERIHMARVKIWYKWGGERGEVEHVGQTAFCGVRKDGKTYTDEDAPKKSVTDALIKALSMVGFAGDIFLGRWDDSGYVADLRAEERRNEREAQQSKSSNVTSLPTFDQNTVTIEQLRMMGNEASERGTSAADVFWNARTDAEKAALKPHVRDWIAKAKAVDKLTETDPDLRGAA